MVPIDYRISQAVAGCLHLLGENRDMKKATKYLEEKLVVSVCRRFKYTKRHTLEDFVVKVGYPNYLEVRFIRACKEAGEPFPVRKVQLKSWPIPRKAKRK